jgi:cell division protein FtsN
MLLRLKYLVFFSLALGFFYFGCSSVEYELEEHQIDYVEKTLKYDTVKKVVQLDTTGRNIVKDNSSKDSYSYIVQIGAFFVKSNFERFFEHARQTLGEEVFYEQTSNNLYKIRIGKYSDKATALKMLDRVKSQGFDDAFVVTVKK